MYDDVMHLIRWYDQSYNIRFNENELEAKTEELVDIWDLYRRRSPLWKQVRDNPVDAYLDREDPEYKNVKIKRYFRRTVAHDRFIEADERHFDIHKKFNPDFLENWTIVEGVVDRKLFVHSCSNDKCNCYDNKYNFGPNLSTFDR